MRRTMTVERIVDAAEGLVAARGLDGLRMADLAAALRVKPPSLYKHVPDLFAVKVLLAQRGWSGLADVFAELGRAGSTPRQLARRWWRFALDHPAAFAAAEAPEMQGSAAVAAGRARAEARAERVFEHAGLTGADAEHAWRTLRALVLGMSHIRRNDEASTVPTEDSFSRALGALFRGWPRA